MRGRMVTYAHGVPPRALVSPALAVVAALTLVAGCSGSDSGDAGNKPAASARQSGAAASTTSPPPGTAPASSTDYTPPTTAPASVPVTPHTKTTAGVFVLVWFESLNYGFASGDANPLRQSTGLGCFTCANWITEIQNQADEKLTHEGGFVHVRDLAYVGPVDDDFLLRAVLDRDPGVVTAPDGTTTPVTAGSGEVVELRVGVSTSTLSKKSFWTVKSLTTPTG